jgi:5-formyltetrahydrofolate cyclo-ligase
MAASAIPGDRAAWRREQRKRLLAARAAAAPEDRAQWERQLAERLGAALHRRIGRIIGLYWPVRGEFDPLILAADLIAAGRALALPAITAKDAPLDYRAWRPGDAMIAGAFGIPAPAAPARITPDIIVVPCLGFDSARYRLGYGGGYFDRTLAALTPRPIALGAAFEQGALATIFPQPHDIALDAIVTEARVV